MCFNNSLILFYKQRTHEFIQIDDKWLLRIVNVLQTRIKNVAFYFIFYAIVFYFFAGEILGSAFSVYYLLKDFMYKNIRDIRTRRVWSLC